MCVCMYAKEVVHIIYRGKEGECCLGSGGGELGHLLGQLLAADRRLLPGLGRHPAAALRHSLSLTSLFLTHSPL